MTRLRLESAISFLFSQINLVSHKLYFIVKRTTYFSLIFADSDSFCSSLTSFYPILFTDSLAIFPSTRILLSIFECVNAMAVHLMFKVITHVYISICIRPCTLPVSLVILVFTNVIISVIKSH